MKVMGIQRFSLDFFPGLRVHILKTVAGLFQQISFEMRIRRGLNRFNNFPVSGATAKISIKRPLDLLFRGVGVVPQKATGAQHKTGGTVTTLKST